MRRSVWIRVLAVVLIISMLAAPVSAATVGTTSTNGGLAGWIGIIIDIIRDLWDDWFDKGDPAPTTPIDPSEPGDTTAPTEPGETTEPSEPTEPGETTEPTTPIAPTEPGETEPEETEPNEPEEGENGVELNLVEGHKTTENGHLLRGVTYTFVPQTLANTITKSEALKPVSTLKSGLSKLGGLSTLAAVPSAQLMAEDNGTDITDGLLAHYDFETVDGMTVSNNVTSNTTTTATLSNGATVVETDYMDHAMSVSNAAGLQLMDVVNAANSSFSVSMWYKAADNSHYNLIQAGTIGGGTGRTILLLNTSSKYFTYLTGDDTRAETNAIDRNVWQHITFSFDKDTSKAYFYINGTVDNAAGITLSDTPLDTDDMIFGRHRGDSDPFNGLIDEIRVYNKVLTAEEAAAVYAYGLPEPEEPEQPETEVELIYFPVTMFNYKQETINSFTDEMDDDLTIREGFYFSDGGSEVPAYFTTTTSMSSYVAGQYYIQNLLAKERSVDSWLQAYNQDGTNKIYGVSQSEATLWTLVIENDQFYLTCLINGETHYLKVGTDGDTDGYTTTKTPVTLSPYGHNATATQISQNGYYLSQWSEYSTDYCGRATNNDYGNGMLFYRVVDGVVSDTPVSPTSVNVITSGYQIWNRWSYSSADNDAQNKFYGGLVEDELDENNEIVFTVNEPGIFTFDAENPTVTNDGKKDIYQNVGLPFVKNDKGYYTFDSDAHGTYFADTTGDGASDPWYGAEDNFFNMYFDYQETQGWAAEGGNLGYGDGSSNLWAPYNTNANDTGAGNIDYHFGMRADIPFSMTPNGRIKSTDDNSEPITFTFKGDDDVWIFIDGHLVIDLGGIHNRIGATIDFADNTITYFKPDSNKQALPIGCFNEPEKYPLNEDGTITVKLYDDAQGEGALGQSRLDFSSEERHEMSIFYLERGEGTSNCQIEFNLPMRDALLITKDATKSWSEAQDKADGDEGDGTINLTAREQAAVNNMNFGFTLYKKNADETAFTAVKSTNFFIQNQDGEIVGNGSTDANGRFYLKNGQTAKFMTDFPKEGVTYYVVEDTVPQGFLTPDYMYDGVSTNGYDYIDADGNTQHITLASEMGEHELALDAAENKSYVVTAYGSIESIDTLEFICVNYLDQRLPNPTAIGNEDIIVIDYGLPVDIDPLANDLFRGDSIEIVAWGDESLELNEVLDEHGHAILDETTWSKPTYNFHSGTVVKNEKTFTPVYDADGNFVGDRDTFTYTLNKQLTEVEVISYIIRVDSEIEGNVTGTKVSATRFALAKVYIVPATIMYYEENFGDLVEFDFSGGGEDKGTITTAGASDRQEPGVVGTIDDSTYGSDLAYLQDSFDSNGTSRMIDTTNGYVRFHYTFTGTGTTFFARTSAKTGYMQVLMFEGDEVGGRGDQFDTYYRDTYYNDTNITDIDDGKALYNIPVYTNEDLEYGTYTVLVTVAMAGTPGAGPGVPTTNAKEHNCFDENGEIVRIPADTENHQCRNNEGELLFTYYSGNEFYLDGIRIMQPLNEGSEREDLTEKALGAYATDGESNLDVVTLRKKLITESLSGETDWSAENFVVLTDTNGEITTADEYTSIGPKEEVYLMPGQKISFTLRQWQREGMKLYIGMKAPFGAASLNVGTQSFSLSNAADCYYDVTEKYASVTPEMVEATTEEGYPIYTDANGNVVVEIFNEDTEACEYYDEDGNLLENVDVDSLEILMQESYIVTYSFEATNSIVSLTNIKVVGSHEFILITDQNENNSGSEGDGEDLETGDPEEDEEIVMP